MNRLFAAGVGLTALSTLGYVLGVRSAYPGRAFALTGAMVGVTLVAVGASR